jgi:hypothetical protein
MLIKKCIKILVNSNNKLDFGKLLFNIFMAFDNTFECLILLQKGKKITKREGKEWYFKASCYSIGCKLFFIDNFYSNHLLF